MTTIIIINYHNEELTIKFVQEELCKLNSEYNIVIVNNEADSESDMLLGHALNAPVIKRDRHISSTSKCYILSSSENLGFAKGNNLGVQFAVKHLHSKYLLFTNNDIQIIQPETLDVLIQTLNQNPKIGMIGPMVRGLNGDFQSPEPYQTFWDRYVWMYISTPFISSSSKTRKFSLDYASKALEGFHYKVMGAFFVLRVEDYINCGMMDSRTFLYAEEVILAERLKKIKKGVYYCPRVCVIHAHGTTTKKTIGTKGINKYRLESESYYYNVYMHEPKWKIKIGSLIYKMIMRLKS